MSKPTKWACPRCGSVHNIPEQSDAAVGRILCGECGAGTPLAEVVAGDHDLIDDAQSPILTDDILVSIALLPLVHIVQRCDSQHLDRPPHPV